MEANRSAVFLSARARFALLGLAMVGVIGFVLLVSCGGDLRGSLVLSFCIGVGAFVRARLRSPVATGLSVVLGSAGLAYVRWDRVSILAATLLAGATVSFVVAALEWSRERARRAEG